MNKSAWEKLALGVSIAVGAAVIANIFWTRKAMALQPPLQPYGAALPAKSVILPDGVGASLSVAPGQRIDVDLSRLPLPAGYRWAITTSVQSGPQPALTLTEDQRAATVTFPGRATRAIITFTAYQYDAQSTYTGATPIGPYAFDVVVE